LIGMGLSALFKSEQPPPFAQSVSQMFGQSNGSQQAHELSPEHVEMIANHAEQHGSGIMDVMGRFYAEHPTLAKTLGSTAMAFVLARMADRQTA
jgi:hypothetical protein